MLYKVSKTITQNKKFGAAHAMLEATGITKDKLNYPFIGISSMGYEGNPCNMHLNGLANKVKNGISKLKMNAFKFNTVGISDGISCPLTYAHHSVELFIPSFCANSTTSLNDLYFLFAVET